MDLKPASLKRYGSLVAAAAGVALLLNIAMHDWRDVTRRGVGRG